jgi:hypothetical protein
MTDSRDGRIAEAREAADRIRGMWPDKAAAIDALVAGAEGDPTKDFPRVKVTIEARLEKFDGEIEPGKTPVEVIDLIDE